MKQELIKIGKKLGLKLDIRYIRISINEAGYYIMHNDKYVWSDICLLINNEHGKFLKNEFINEAESRIIFYIKINKLN